MTDELNTVVSEESTAVNHLIDAMAAATDAPAAEEAAAPAEAKETPVQYAQRQIAKFERLLGTFQREMPSDWYNTVTEKVTWYLAEGGINPENARQVSQFAKDGMSTLTGYRIANIRTRVEKAVARWETGRYAVPFATTAAKAAAARWLVGVAPDAVQTKTYLEWIQAGWELLKGGLESPWGKCSDCEKTLLPVQLTDKVTGNKLPWKVFKLCVDCAHRAPVVQRQDLNSLTSGKRTISKPGSAARRHTGENQTKPGAKQYRKGQKNK